MIQKTNDAAGFEAMKADYLAWAEREIQVLMERQAGLDINSVESAQLGSRIGLLMLKVSLPGLYPYSFA